MFVGLSGFNAYAFILAVLFGCGMGVPIPEDITLIAAGYLAGKGQITFAGAMIVGFFGVLLGDTVLFFLGKKFGRRVFTLPLARLIFTEERVKRAEERIQNNAKLICFTARFAPGLRSAIFLTAGVLRVPFRTFISQDGFAALISVPVWVWAGWSFHSEIDRAFALADEALIYVLGFVALVAIYLFWKNSIKKKKSIPPNESQL